MGDDLQGLLKAVADGDLDVVPIVCDLLEERGDERAAALRRMYVNLYEDFLYAPYSFRHFRVTRSHVLPLFPEYDLESE